MIVIDMIFINTTAAITAFDMIDIDITAAITASI